MPGKRWTPAEVRSLKRAWEEHGRVSAIKLRGRSSDSIKRKLVREGLAEEGAAGRQTWTGDDEEELRVLVARGMTAREIQRERMSERSYHSVAQKISRMKLLAGEGRSQQLRDCRRLGGRELDEFVAAVEEHGEARHTGWFVWKFAVGRGKVKRALEAVGRGVSWRDAMQLPQTRQRFASRVGHASAEAWERRRDRMRAEMGEEQKAMEAELEAEPKLAGRARYTRRECAGCGARWFADKAFYKASFKRLPGGGRRRYLQRSCRICTSRPRGASARERELEVGRRERWRSALSTFDEMMVHTHPELYRDPGEALAVRWEPFVDLLESKSTREVMALVESVVQIYAEAKVSDVLDRLEELCFGGEAELHFDLWSLDEMLRAPVAERPTLVGEGELLPDGHRLAIRLYRVVRLAQYAQTLV